MRSGLPKRAFSGATCAGGVLGEYVLITAIIVASLFGKSGVMFRPGGHAFPVEQAIEGVDFGLLGNAFAKMYDLVVKGISLPLP